MFKIQTLDYNQENRQNFSQGLMDSLKETGFAVIKNPPINFSLINELYTDWATFFQTPSRFDFLYDPSIQAGLFPFESESAKNGKAPDLKEFFHFYPWHFRSSLFSKTSQLFDEMEYFGLLLLEMMEEKMPKHIRDSFYCPLPKMAKSSRSTLLRILHYPEISPKDRMKNQRQQVRAYEHEDINLITLLPTSTTPGLMVKDLEGSWHPVPFLENSIVINTGDMMQKCTRNFLRATTHQVLEIQEDPQDISPARYSFPLFMHPWDHIPLTPQLTAGDFLRQRLKQLGLLQEKDWIHHKNTFCGLNSLQNPPF